MQDQLLEKINYLEKNHEEIIKRFLKIGACSNYEKIKKDCGVKISILNKLIELGKQHRGSNQNNVLEDQVHKLLKDIDPNDESDAIVEISVNKESKESEYFLKDLQKMYKNYAGLKNWKYILIYNALSKKGFLKHILFEIKGRDIFRHLKYESGLHSKKDFKEHNIFIRVHPSISKEEVKISKEDLQIETFHSSTHGGQSVNTADSAVRITHIPTGISAISQNERSQYLNKENALNVLRARIITHEEERLFEERALERALFFIDHVDRNKIRTYDFNKNVIIDYRLNKVFKNLKHILKGYINEIIDDLIEYDEVKRINYLLDL